MKSQSVVTDLRRQVFAEVAKVAYKSESVASDIEAIPYIITPDEEPKYRENIYVPQTSPFTSPMAWMQATLQISITNRPSCRSFLRPAISAPTTSMW